MFFTGMKRKISWEGELPKEEKVVVEVKEQPPKPQTPKPKVRNGNGHKSKKLRELTDADRDYIKTHFIHVDGILKPSDKLCKSICSSLNETADPELNRPNISTFQVTGYVSVLHRQIASGDLELKNEKGLGRYLEWMSKQYKLWSRYNSEKYKKYREKKLEVGGVKPPKPRYVHGL